MPAIASLVGWVFSKLTTLPADGVEGQVEYSNDLLYLRDSADWTPIGGAYQYSTSGVLAYPKIWMGVGTANTSGDVTFTWPSGLFSTVHGVFPTVERATTTPSSYAFAFVRSLTATSAIVRVGESKTTTSGALSTTVVEGLETTTSAVTVKALVVGV